MYTGPMKAANFNSHDEKNSNIAAGIRVMQDAVRSGAGFRLGLRWWY